MFTVISEQSDFLVINKHAGVHFHSQDGTAGVVATAEQQLGLKLYPVHRLDTLTSGLLLLAKSSDAARDFTELFSQHRVQKYYLALAQGKPKKKQGRIAGDMAKSRRSQYKLTRTLDNPAITQFFSHSVAEGLRLYLLKPLTGKTHQLRVALASLGVPILGDSLYGGAAADRGYLHAYELNFNFRGTDYLFRCPPEQGQEFLLPQVTEQLQGAWFSATGLDWPV
ncbi:TIGR01621 family pseudouridine synthase [Shewanella sedimentimangrovi]|uniref:TIGR01621 family pseudouridine synthase n=1 Tax=Shewanella sedimentimangrovi TaxID=2814293 RepID=A0ABX7R296_9GAMM|nr:TIGR01621 family pseudouridine synthase [Shewanella sedimentimangrovi]QSX37185.1 TIGR01621 family pseudouridine synthase [Shewanella sedimentimangrovi]